MPTDTIEIEAHAKVNLFLRVFARDTSGFHGIETAFCLLELADHLRFDRTDSGIDLDVTGADTGPVEDNLVYRAARMALATAGEETGIRIELTKNIPVGAGLGGGSSDAAATLHAVNRMTGGKIPRTELIQMAATLGSDVPFFAAELPMAVAWNRGERMHRVRPPEPGPVLLVCPDVAFSTPQAYAELDDSRSETQRGAVVLDQDAFDSWSSIGRLGGNDFESIAFGRHPDLRKDFERLAETGPLVLRMSGTGSALFAIYRNERERDNAVMLVQGADKKVISTATRRLPPTGPSAVDRR